MVYHRMRVAWYTFIRWIVRIRSSHVYYGSHYQFSCVLPRYDYARRYPYWAESELMVGLSKAAIVDLPCMITVVRSVEDVVIDHESNVEGIILCTGIAIQSITSCTSSNQDQCARW